MLYFYIISTHSSNFNFCSAEKFFKAHLLWLCPQKQISINCCKKSLFSIWIPFIASNQQHPKVSCTTSLHRICVKWQRKYTLCLKRTSPTFPNVGLTWKPIIRFWDTTCHQMTSQFSTSNFVSALPEEKTTSKISLFYAMRYDCSINIMHKTHFVHISDTLADISSSCPFFNCLQ